MPNQMSRPIYVLLIVVIGVIQLMGCVEGKKRNGDIDISASDLSSAPGSQGGPCYGNGTCDSGLICSAKICVRNIDLSIKDYTPNSEIGTKSDSKVMKKDQGQYNGPNSGKLCKNDSECPNSNEKCLYGTSMSWGMCLMTCIPGTTCPHPTPGPYASECKFSYKASGGTTSYACGWYCSYQGVNYKCPNTTDYDCWAPNSSEPNIKFCIPK